MADNNLECRGLQTYLAVKKRLAEHQISILLCLDAVIVAALYILNTPAREHLVAVPWWYWPIIYIPFLGLIWIEEEAKHLPLQFTRVMLAVPTISCALGVAILVQLVSCTLSHCLPSMTVQVTGNQLVQFAGSIHAGISEEGFKIGIVVGVAYLVETKVSTLERRRDLVWTLGALAIAVWAYLHVLIAKFTLSEFTFALFGGMILFVVFIATNNIVLTMASHALYDAMANGQCSIGILFLECLMMVVCFALAWVSYHCHEKVSLIQIFMPRMIEETQANSGS